MRAHLPAFLERVLRTEIRDRRELVGYVVRTSVVCSLLALGLDIANQLTFFIDWETTLRSWLITVCVAFAIAVPVTIMIARAHLELYRAKAVMEELSRRDPLTGLLNRRALFECAEGPPDALALVIVDIDRFKRVNDTHGHLVGDEVIRAVGSVMEEHLGDFGRVGRLGGEEFALLSSRVAPDVLEARLWDFRDRIAGTPVLAGTIAVSVTVSGGMATRSDGQTFADLYSAADRALYMAKAAGRNRIVVAPAFAAGATSAGADADWIDTRLPTREAG